EQQQRPKRVSLKNIRNLAAWDIDVRESILGLAGSGSSCGGPAAPDSFVTPRLRLSPPPDILIRPAAILV
ncbi:MAG: hypothetical protein VB143_07345, partial [Burkholderia sp.]